MKLSDSIIDEVPVTIEQEGKLLTLHFNNGVVQSQIDLDSADKLPSIGNRMMLSHLMFTDVPNNILLAGCGGGAIARWFNAVLPKCHGVAVEISSDIINLAREHFQFPGTESNWRLMHADVRDYISEPGDTYDFILFDIEENGQTPAWMIQPEFLLDCRKRLSDHGVTTFNIIARSSTAFAEALWPIRRVFPEATCCLGNPNSQNIMILAFKNKPAIGDLKENARRAAEKYHIEFDEFYQQMLQDNPPGSGVF